MTDPTPTAQLAPAPAATSAQEPQAEITQAEAAIMIGWEKDNLAKGRITLEEANKRFDSLGATVEQRAPDTRSDEVKQLDAHFPPAKQEDFLIRYGVPGQELPMTKELKDFDTSARTWLSGAEFPRDLGNSLVSAIDRVAQQTKHMTADQLETYGYAEFEKLEKAHGSTLDAKLRAAGRMVEELDAKQPGLKNLLKSRGIGDAALVANMLIAQAQVYWARRGKS